MGSKGQTSPAITVAIHDIGHAGEGVGRHENMTVFLPGAIPGDVVLARPIEKRQRYMRAELLRILQPSPDRATPGCPVSSRCGGCQLQHLSYPAQLAWKTERVRQVLARVGGVENPPVLPIVPAAFPRDYRNKAQFPVARLDGTIRLGFYETGSHRLVPAESCHIQHPLIRAAAEVVAAALNALQIPPYNESTGAGLIRHVLCRVSFAERRLLVTLVATRRFRQLDALTDILVAELPELAGVTLNINSAKGNRILGDDNSILWGEGYLEETLRVGDLQARFRISAPAFFQVNPVQAQELFGAVIRYAEVDDACQALDAYCGAGSISLFLALAGARHVWGIEETPEAVADARRNAEINGIANASFVAGRVEDVAERLMDRQRPPDVLVVDPPRSGLESAFLRAAARWRPRRWVYVSCNPATLARDIALLKDEGYRLHEAQPVDMFPHTAHIECVALLLPQ